MNLLIIFITYQGWKHDLLRGLSGSEKALAQAKNLRYVNDRLGVVFFVRQQNEKSEDVWHDLLGIRNFAILHQLHLLDDEADENLVRVQQAIIDSELYELNEQLKNLMWREGEGLRQAWLKGNSEKELQYSVPDFAGARHSTTCIASALLSPWARRGGCRRPGPHGRPSCCRGS